MDQLTHDKEKEETADKGDYNPEQPSPHQGGKNSPITNRNENGRTSCGPSGSPINLAGRLPRITLFSGIWTVNHGFAHDATQDAVFRRTRWQSLGESNPSSQIENLMS